jgi:hypothetical protein
MMKQIYFGITEIAGTLRVPPRPLPVLRTPLICSFKKEESIWFPEGMRLIRFSSVLSPNHLDALLPA